jgi:DNA-binding GntR family transcriptional regulator
MEPSELEASAPRRADLRYVQVADDIERRIASGELKPGTRLISERDLSGFYGCSYGTIRRSMKELRTRGLIETIHGKGTFVVRVDRPAGSGHT